MENSAMATIVLVTGGSGYLGLQCVLQLLQEGYTVKTTIRSLAKKDEIIHSLKAGGIRHFDKLSFVEADLTKDNNWAEAVRDCTYVLHVASPFPAIDPKDENEIIVPARDGSLRVLKAARDAGVKRVVLTSSFAAIGYSRSPKDYVFTEKDWTDPNTPGLRPYLKDLETFMNKNFRFNIKLEQFAFLTGRSLSTFKRDFNKVFNEMPGAWLTRKRLEEAHFQIKHESKKPGDVYLEVGFENLSHFSCAFKKQFGKSPVEVQKAN